MFFISKLTSSVWKFAVQVVKESAELSKELQGLGQQSFSSDPGVGELSEAIKLCEENSMHDIFQG